MSNIIRAFKIALAASSLTTAAWAQVTLSPEQEAVVLMHCAPYIVTDAQPIPIDWWVSHCELRWEKDAKATGDVKAALETITKQAKGQANLRLTAKGDEDAVKQAREGKGLGDDNWMYGAVFPTKEGTVARVAYFFFFGWNEPEILSNPFKKIAGKATGHGADPGQHEGDWECVDFDVDLKNPAKPVVLKVILHNHGRQLFVDKPLEQKGIGTKEKDGVQHLLVYLEDGTHEPWPFKGDDKGDGFAGSVPDWVKTNKHIAPDMTEWSWLPGIIKKEVWKECEKAVVRGHDKAEPVRIPGKIVNVGAADPAESADPVILFFHRYDGAYGEAHSDHGKPPPGPRHQEKMWDRKFATDLAKGD